MILFRILNLTTLIQRGGGTWPYETRQPAICKVLIPAKCYLILEDKVWLPKVFPKWKDFFVLQNELHGSDKS
jgi:hypothetical protein